MVLPIKVEVDTHINKAVLNAKDPVLIQRKYLKKDNRKNVKGFQRNDYNIAFST